MLKRSFAQMGGRTGPRPGGGGGRGFGGGRIRDRDGRWRGKLRWPAADAAAGRSRTSLVSNIIEPSGAPSWHGFLIREIIYGMVDQSTTFKKRQERVGSPGIKQREKAPSGKSAIKAAQTGPRTDRTDLRPRRRRSVGSKPSSDQTEDQDASRAERPISFLAGALDALAIDLHPSQFPRSSSVLPLLN